MNKGAFTNIKSGKAHMVALCAKRKQQGAEV